MTPNLEKLLRTCTRLPSLPTVAVRILELAQLPDDDETDISAELIGLVQGDVALSAQLLKAANSPLFRGRAGVASVAAAVRRLGENTSLALGLGFAVIRAVTVEEVIVTEQPMGANHTYLKYLQDMAGNEFRTVALHDRLLIDVGHVTVDAIGVTGARIIPGTSACPHHSVSKVIDKLAHLTGVKDLSRLSAGLLTGQVRWQAQNVDLGPHMEQALEMLDPAIQEIENVLSDHAGRFEEVVLAGGGAFLFLEHVHQAFPRQPIVLMGRQPSRWWLEDATYPDKVVTVAENLESYQVVVNGYLEGGLAWRRARA